MGEKSLDRLVTHSLEKSVGFKGVREDDEFLLDIFQERRRTFRLKRTKYKITTASSFSFDFTAAEITLPVFENEISGYELMLIKHASSLRFNNQSRYLLRSTGRIPFKLNGVQCFEAFIERGDVVDIGFNRIQFLRPKGHLRLSEESGVLSEEMVKSSLNIMIEGETGTGKTTLAKNIHEESLRTGAFIHLNLSSFSPSLIESELFGHVKGAFTGAIGEKRGAILEANKGTLFLDEIDSLSIELQTKLLLFLDSLEVRPVGGSSVHKVEVRLIFASGSKMKALVSDQKMRRDFYFRLTSGVVVSLSSLRETPERIRELCQDFEQKHFCVFDDRLIDFYQECSWPGNIRQLTSHLMKKKILSNGKKIVQDNLDCDLLGDKVNALGFEHHQLKSLEEIKMDYCLRVFMKHDKNVTRAAKILEISPNTLKAILANRKNAKEKNLRDHEIVDINF
ncbi:MAG: sigma 54-interacting transcriptional regulator [Bacteriovorax sp.]